MLFKVLHQTMKQKVITLSLSASVVIGSYGQQMSKHTRSFQNQDIT